MAKGYWIAHVEVTDPEAYKAYLAANAVAFAKFGARFLVRGGSPCRSRRAWRKPRQVVIEFKDYATALACLESRRIQARRRCSATPQRSSTSSSSRAMTGRSPG